MQTLPAGSRPAEIGGLSTLDRAVLTTFALSFGPLSRNDLVAAMKQAAMAMADGSAITAEKLRPSIQRLKQKGWIANWGSSPPECPPEVRVDAIEVARAKGELRRLGEGLQKAMPAHPSPGDWDYQWRRGSFVSFSHACREVFLALEREDRTELDRLPLLCKRDEGVQSLVHVLYAICGDPFQPEYVDRLTGPVRNELLYAVLRNATYELALESAVFPYVRAKVLTERNSFEKSVLEICVNHIVERDILAGDLSGARALLEAFSDLETHIIRGMLELVCGDLVAARQAYDRAVQRAGKAKRDQVTYLGSFPALLHMLLLVQSGQAQDLRQARTWLGWLLKGGSHSTYCGAYFFLDALLTFYEGHADFDGPAWRPLHRQEPSLVCLATCLMQMFYSLYASDAKALKARNGEALLGIEELLGQ